MIDACSGRTGPRARSVRPEGNHSRRYGPSGILTFSESMLPATARLAARLGLPYHDESVVATLTRS